MPQQPPTELSNAIQSSSQKYGVPVDILTGVWIKESGASFPNNYVNSSGYGGLFGTTNWNGSTQSQTDYAASILAHLHSQYGNWTTALYHYSGGGYTSVPGQTTSGGSLTGVTGKGAVSPTQPASGKGASGPQIPGVSDIANAIGNIGTTIQNDLPNIGISVGLGVLGVWLIIGGIIIIGFSALNKVADQPAVKTVAEAIP